MLQQPTDLIHNNSPNIKSDLKLRLNWLDFHFSQLPVLAHHPVPSESEQQFARSNHTTGLSVKDFCRRGAIMGYSRGGQRISSCGKFHWGANSGEISFY